MRKRLDREWMDTDVSDQLDAHDRDNPMQASPPWEQCTAEEAFSRWCNYEGLVRYGPRLVTVLKMLREAQGRFRTRKSGSENGPPYELPLKVEFAGDDLAVTARDQELVLSSPDASVDDLEWLISGTNDPWRTIAEVQVRTNWDGAVADGFRLDTDERKNLIRARCLEDFRNHLVDAYMAAVNRALEER